MSDQEWRVLDGEGNEQGPYSFQDLQSYYSSGNITHETMIWTEGLEEWVQAGQVEGLLPDIPQIVPLAAAPTVAVAAPVAHPAATGGINLSPQISGVPPGIAPGHAGQLAPAQSGAPRWLVNINLTTCLAAIFLFFLPWVELRCSNSDYKKGQDNEIGLPDKTLILTQSGFQSILGNTTPSEESIKAKGSDEEKEESKEKPKKQKSLADLGIGDTPEKQPEPEPEPATEPETESSTPDNLGLGDDEGNYPPAHFVLIGFISLGLATLLAIIGFTGAGRVLLFLSQLFCLIAGALIAFQVAMGFPILPSPRYAGAVGGEPAVFAAALLKEAAYTEYTIWLIIELIVLGSSLLFMIIGFASRNPTTITIPQPGLPPQPGQPQQPAQAQQPGGALKFH
ncbi:DUF4339 domain-containing protein [bacterium]|nr:DUF4339 domain-containing protein [bacterium]